jgi:CDP-diacylglycerol--serine O-phosphatidyltransferase
LLAFRSHFQPRHRRRLHREDILVQKKFIVPNLFTGLNFLLGIYAILLMTESLAAPGAESALGLGKPPVILAGWFIIWCALLDKLDGFSAKILKASSEFGAQFDSLADLTAFGIAPGFLVYFYLRTEEPVWFAAHLPLMIASVSIFMLCAALRLARFNAIDSGELKAYFHGLPSTFAGAFIAVSVILHWRHGLSGRIPWNLPILPLFLILMGLLMVSPLYLPKLMRRHNPIFNGFQILNILAAYLCGFGMIFPEYLYALGIAYGVIGFAYGLFNRERIEREANPAPEGAG